MPSDLKVDSTDIKSVEVAMDDEENTEKWLEKEDIDTVTFVHAQNKLEHEEDVSFSDLEDDVFFFNKIIIIFFFKISKDTFLGPTKH